MTISTTDSFASTIYIAGDYDQAREACRQFCLERGLCVTVTRTTYIYSGGEEAGVAVGLINYPRFPTERGDLANLARELGEFLMEWLHQMSFTVVGPDSNVWYSRREQEETRIRKAKRA